MAFLAESHGQGRPKTLYWKKRTSNISGQIFICYRRDDTAYVTGYINDRLSEEFGADAVFTDVDNIALGVDFRAILDETVGQCQIFLAVIGDNWLTARNADGKLRLQDPSDFVRIEIESALQRNIPVIPLLVDGTTMPSKEELPDSMRDLAFRNGTVIRPAPDFHADIDRLVNSLKRYLRAGSNVSNSEDRKSDASAAAGQVEEERNKGRTKKGAAREGENASKPTRTIIRPADEDRVRHQAELRSSRTLNWRDVFVFRPLVVIGLVILVGASWYIDFEYRQQFNDAFAALQGMTGAARDTKAEVGPPTEAQDELVDASEPATESLADVQPESDSVVESREETEIDPDAQPAQETAPDARAVTDTVAEVESIAEEAGEVDPVADAESAAEPIVEAEPERVPSEIFGDGVSLAARGDHETAIEHYDEAIQLGVDSGFAYRQRGASYYALGNHEAAIKDFDEAIRLNAEDISAYLSRGDAYHAIGEYEAASMDYDEAIRINADDADVSERR